MLSAKRIYNNLEHKSSLWIKYVCDMFYMPKPGNHTMFTIGETENVSGDQAKNRDVVKMRQIAVVCAWGVRFIPG